MKNKLVIKNIIIISLCITIILLGIGFSLVSMNLWNRVNNDQFDVVVSNVSSPTIINNSEIIPNSDYKIMDNNKTVRFNYSLNNIGDSIKYVVTIKNKGTMDAKIDNIAIYNDIGDNSIEVKNNNLKGKVLHPNDEVNFELDVISLITKKDNKFNISTSVLASSIN